MRSCRGNRAVVARSSAAAVVAFGLLLGGCGEEIPEALTEQATGLDAEIGGPDASPPEGAQADDEFEPHDGNYPDELPEEFPLPGGMELVDSSVEEADGSTVVAFETRYDDDFDQAVLFFDTELPAAGWTVVDQVETDEDADPTVRWDVEGHGWTGTVELRQAGDVGDIGGASTTLLVELRG